VSLATWLGVAVLGGAGAILRFVVDGQVAGVAGRTFPFGTLAINLSGSFALGALLGGSLTGDSYLLAGTATIGSYTTFSTWMYETQRLVEDDETRSAMANIVCSLALGLLAAAAGRWIGARL
jgi:CrcB protein